MYRFTSQEDDLLLPWRIDMWHHTFYMHINLLSQAK